jgi:hypothetical protein
MLGNRSVSVAALLSHDRVCTVFQGVLRAAQVAGWTDEALFQATGIPARTIQSYRIEGKEPCAANLLALVCVLGKSGVNPMLALIGWTATPLDEPDTLDPRRLIADVLPHVSVLAEAAADGRIDHTERAQCRAAADQIIATVMPLSSAGEAA